MSGKSCCCVQEGPWARLEFYCSFIVCVSCLWMMRFSTVVWMKYWRVQLLYWGVCSDLFDHTGSVRHLFKFSLWRWTYILDKRNAPIEETVSLELVPRFVEFIHEGGTLNLKRDAVSVLGVVAAGSSAHTDSVVQTGVIPTLISLLLCVFFTHSNFLKVILNP